MKQEKLIEDQPIPVSKEGTEQILFQMQNCICIIIKENGKKGTGFFCKIPFNNNILPVLITNNHILNEYDIEDGKIIELMINNKVKKIEIDKSRKKYTNPDENIDITIIEINQNKDDIKNYLELDENDINKKEENIKLEYRKKSIYILHYPKGELCVSYGLIKDIIDNKTIYHKCNTEEGSSGGPILSLKTFKVIGIHYGCIKGDINLNNGIFIKYAIDLNRKANKKKYNLYKNENNIYPLQMEIKKRKLINREILFKNKENISSSLIFDEKTIIFNDDEKKHYNSKNNQNHLNHAYSSSNKNNTLSFSEFNHRKIVNSNPEIITDKKCSKKYNANLKKIPNIKYNAYNIMRPGEYSLSYIGNEYQLKLKSEFKKSKSNDILFNSSRMLNKSEDFTHLHTQNKSFLCLTEKNENNNKIVKKITKYQSNKRKKYKINRRKNTQNLRKQNLEKIYEKENGKENKKKNTVSFGFFSPKHSSIFLSIEGINSIGLNSKEEIKQKNVDGNLNKNNIRERVNSNKNYQISNLNENRNNDNNKSKLNETINRGMIADSICISEDKKNLKIKNDNNKFSKTYLLALSSKISKKEFKPNKITFINTKEKNYLNTPLNKEENNKKQIIQRNKTKSNNKIFNKKKENFKARNNLMKIDLFTNTQNHFSNRVDKIPKKSKNLHIIIQDSKIGIIHDKFTSKNANSKDNTKNVNKERNSFPGNKKDSININLYSKNSEDKKKDFIYPKKENSSTYIIQDKKPKK